MVKKIVRTTTAAMAMASMFAMTAFASEATPWNQDGGKSEVTGDAWTVAPTVEVELPGDLAFGINPLRLKVDDGTTNGTKAQIITSDYVISNYSNVPVIVNAKTKIIAADKVDIVSTPTYNTDTSELDPSSTDGNKNIWLVQLYPTGDATVSAEGEVKLTTTPLADKATAAGTAGKVLTADDADTDVNFLLQAFDETLKAANVNGFQFTGAVDPNAAFEEGDVKVQTTFQLKTLSEQQKDGYKDHTTLTTAKGLVEAK